MSESPPPSETCRFAPTQWSLVLAAGQIDGSVTEAALAQLCRTYWYPFYAFVRRRGTSHHDAQDLTQAFFATLMAKNNLGDASRDRAGFRTFLLASLKNLLANDWHKRSARKRGGGIVFIALVSEACDRFERAAERYPEESHCPGNLYGPEASGTSRTPSASHEQSQELSELRRRTRSRGPGGSLSEMPHRKRGLEPNGRPAGGLGSDGGGSLRDASAAPGGRRLRGLPHPAPSRQGRDGGGLRSGGSRKRAPCGAQGALPRARLRRSAEAISARGTSCRLDQPSQFGLRFRHRRDRGNARHRDGNRAGWNAAGAGGVPRSDGDPAGGRCHPADRCGA